MKDQLLQRLRDLQAEFESGEKLLAELEGKATHIRSSLLRISGAIQVLEELLIAASPNDQHTTSVEPAHGAHVTVG
jgi:hypothetical protein